MGKRHRRIRARSATGQVAGAATEKPGLNSPSSKTACPTCVLPEGPSSQSAEPKPAAGHHQALKEQFHAPRSGSVSLSGILRPVDVQDWWSGGELVPLELGGTEQGVFVRREGSGPSMTLLHGFPSSWPDWAKIAPALAERYALTMPDLLGFGASTKPHEHRYSLLEQADLVEALWASEGIDSTVVVAHDLTVSVAQELLTRRAAGALAVDLRALHFMNGGIYPDLHRPQPAQVALLDREQGPQISAAIDRRGVHGGPRADVPGGVRLGWG